MFHRGCAQLMWYLGSRNVPNETTVKRLAGKSEPKDSIIGKKIDRTHTGYSAGNITAVSNNLCCRVFSILSAPLVTTPGHSKKHTMVFNKKIYICTHLRFS